MHSGAGKKICPLHKNRAVNLHTNMTNRTQRLFCFLVALAVAGGQNHLQAQVTGVGLSGSVPAGQVQGSLLLNSSLPGQAPASLPQMTLTSAAEKDLAGDFGQNRGLLPFSSLNPVNSEAYSPQIRAFSFADGLANPPFTGNGRRQYIPSNNYYIQSGFFCKREWEMERSTRIPFRFRLGSLAQCNALEGKP